MAPDTVDTSTSMSCTDSQSPTDGPVFRDLKIEQLMKATEDGTTSALDRADHARRQISPTLDAKRRSKLGQFMTPASVASFMARMFDGLPAEIHLLDAGAGVGSLTAAFVREACGRTARPNSISVTAFEVDPQLRALLEETLSACADDCAKIGVAFSKRVVSEDYILHSATELSSPAYVCEQYNVAILNPPYAKVNTDSDTRRALSRLGIEASNLYAAFVAVAVRQLCAAGQLVAITPRSFCNGSYFEFFRRYLLTNTALRKIHVYESRIQAFKDDEVLQENVVFHLSKADPQPVTLEISVSDSPDDGAVTRRDVQFIDVVLPSDPHAFIRLPTSDQDGDLALRVQALPCSLRDLGITVSTGRVVDFRVPAFLRKEPESGAVPLIYPSHFSDGYVSWPQANAKKSNALVRCPETEALMVPRGTYVLTKRFSSKEEKRRLVAAIYEPSRIHADVIGFENHLNYFHLQGSGLAPGLARGLALFLNSTAVDQYFRQFSGHTQVNATDLRNLRFPTAEMLERIGPSYGDVLPPQERIDEIVEGLLN